jgi:hypothetical protein
VQYTHTVDVAADYEKHVVSNDATKDNFCQIYDGIKEQRSGAYLKLHVFLVAPSSENTVS